MAQQFEESKNAENEQGHEKSLGFFLSLLRLNCEVSASTGKRGLSQNFAGLIRAKLPAGHQAMFTPLFSRWGTVNDHTRT